MPETIAELIEELLEDADDGRLDPLQSVYCERHAGLVEYLQTDAAEGWHMRSTIGAVLRRVLADGTVAETFTEPDEWATPEAWVYLPAPIDWPACPRDELAAWLAGPLEADL